VGNIGQRTEYKSFGEDNSYMSLYTSEINAGSLVLSPQISGDIKDIGIDGETYYIQKNAFFACTAGLTVKTKFKDIFTTSLSEEKMSFFQISGRGVLFVSTFGALIEKAP